MSIPDFKGIQAAQFYSSENGAFTMNKFSSERILQSFVRQELAFTFFDELCWDLRRHCKIFSYESPAGGQRIFLVAHVELFGHEYFTVITNKEFRHAYEIIREKFPCRLYFDLEYTIEHNPSLDGNELTAKWIQLVTWQLYEVFGLCLGRQHVLVLDSTTTAKFSKHVVVHMVAEGQPATTGSQPVKCREYLFQSNAEVGRLVQRIIFDITEPWTPVDEADASRAGVDLHGHRRAPRPGYEDLWVSSGGRQTCFVDLGVYSRNRAFRLFGSSKFGKTHALALTQADRRAYTAADRKDTPTPHHKAEESLVGMRLRLLKQSFVVPHDLLTGQPAGTRAAAEDSVPGWEDSTAKTVATGSSQHDILNVGCDVSSPEIGASPSRAAPPPAYWRALDAEKFALLPALGAHIPHQGGARHGRSAASPGLALQPPSASRPSPRGVEEVARSRAREPSWFPAVDEFVSTHFACIGGVRGALGSWSLMRSVMGGPAAEASEGAPQSFTFYRLQYQVRHNRWCHRVGRAHRSNAIMLEVDLTRREVTQTCWDVDCRGFRSAAAPLPEGLVPPPEELHAEVQRLLGKRQRNDA